jgi:hypothetical protein
MIARLLADLRRLRRWLAWARRVRQGDIAGAEALFTEDLETTHATSATAARQAASPTADQAAADGGGTDDPLLVVTSLDPAEVGRQRVQGEAILDTAAWLEASGWADLDAGERQVYASWLLERRAAYERGEARIS